MNLQVAACTIEMSLKSKLGDPDKALKRRTKLVRVTWKIMSTCHDTCHVKADIELVR
jgi:hypothetical protein